MLNCKGQLASEIQHNEWMLDITLLSALRLGLEQALAYLYASHPTLEQFEAWICETAGKPADNTIRRFNSIFTGNTTSLPHKNSEQLLNQDDIDHWNKHGYVIIRNAVPLQDCNTSIEAICQHIGINRFDPGTWYDSHPDRHNIMIRLFQHPALEKTRNAEKIRIAFQQLWGREDVWLTTDRVGFNPPETTFYKYPGQGLHWDVSLQLPIPFSTQGILYLADTAEDQGAFSLVPGFQHRIEHWLSTLPEEIDARSQDIECLGVKRISANAGDLIIWQQALPHGSSPNTSDQPRFVQYINYLPADRKIHANWI